MAERKKHRRWNRAAKVSQFTRGAGGEMIYVGRYYSFQGDEKSYRRAMRLRIALAAIMAVAELACGMMPVPALFNTWYVIAPYAMTVLAVGLAVWAVCRMAYWGNPLREYIHDVTVRRFPKRMIVILILSMCTLCGQVVYLVTHSLQGDQYLYSFVFLALQVVVFVCAFLWKREESNMLWFI